MPSIETLKRKKDFKNCALLGKKIRGKYFSIYFFKSGNELARFGFVVKKKLEKLLSGIR